VALGACLVGCSLQDFDALSSQSDGLGRAGTGGALGGASGSAGSAGAGGSPNDGGSGGSGAAPVAGNGGGPAGAGGSNDPGGSGGAAGTGGGSAGVGGSSVTLPDGGVVEQNLLSDPGFEGGHVDWIGFGEVEILDVEGEGRDGSRCIYLAERVATFSGPASPELRNLLVPERRYRAEAWVRMETDADTTRISLKASCTGLADAYTQLTSAGAIPDDWTFLTGEFDVPAVADCTLTELRFYIEGPDPINSFYVDDVGLYFVE